MEEQNDKTPKVVGLPDFKDNRPIAEVPLRERLGTLIRRHRVSASKSLRETAERLDLSDVMLGEVERGVAILQAGQLQELAAFLNIRYDPLLEAARDWHKSLWEDDGEKGVILGEMTTKTASLRPYGESEMELALIRAADDLVFMSNICREVSVRAERTALEVRELLERRGVMIPPAEPLDGPEEVECAGPSHSPKLPVRLRRGKDFVLAFQPEDDGDIIYFCSKRCGDEWRVQAAQADQGSQETP